MEATPFIWRDKPADGIRNLLDAMFEIHRPLTKPARPEPKNIGEQFAAALEAAMRAPAQEVADEFLRSYREVNPHADDNIGYVLGYVEPPELRRSMYALFKATHPAGIAV